MFTFSCIHIHHASLESFKCYDILIHSCLIFRHQHKPDNHEFGTSYPAPIHTFSKTRTMENDNASWFEHIEKAYHELQEKYLKSQKDISEMMEMMMTLNKGKRVTESSNPKKYLSCQKFQMKTHLNFLALHHLTYH